MAAVMLLGIAPALSPPVEAQSCTPTTKTYPAKKLKAKDKLVQGHFRDTWDLTQGDLEISFTYVATGLIDDFPANVAHAVANLGVRPTGQPDFNPANGMWMSATYDNAANTFVPDPMLDLDDKLILQKSRGSGEGQYDLPSPPPTPRNNHHIWFDRDGASNATFPQVDGATYNSGGLYDVTLSISQVSASNNVAYLNINGLDQGFETDGDWNTIELSPAGMSFSGIGNELQVFYALLSYGSSAVMQEVRFENIMVTGILNGSCSP
jgi:hypothetical protein